MKKSIYTKALFGEARPAPRKKKTIDLVIIKLK